MTSALVVIGSPNPDSFVHAMAARATSALTRAGVSCEVHDLYAEAFPAVGPFDEAFTAGLDVEEAITSSNDPIVQAHRAALSQASHLVIAHPNWWGKPPAIVAGWIDRVLVPGVAYRLDERDGLPVSLLSLQSMLVLNSGDTPPERERAVFGDPLDAIWRRCVGAYLGEARVDRIVASPLGSSGEAQRAGWLAAVDDAIALTELDASA